MSVEPSVQRHLRDLEERLLQPEVRCSPREVMTLLDEGFVEFGCSGRVYERQSVVEALQAEAARTGTAASRAITDFVARLLAQGVILVTYRLIEMVGSGQSPIESLRSSIWSLQDRRWRLVFHQGTPGCPSATGGSASEGKYVEHRGINTLPIVLVRRTQG